MNRDFYFYGNVFLGLTLVSGILQSILFFLVGVKMFWFGSFAGWFIVTSIVTVTASVFLVKYYRHKGYPYPFYFGIATIVSQLAMMVVVCLLLYAPDLAHYYSPAVAVGLGTQLMYGLALMFSRAGKHPWLKAAGSLTFATSLALALTLVWGQVDDTFQPTGQSINQWLLMVGRLIPFFFIMHFHAEARMLSPDSQVTDAPNGAQDLPGFFGILALVAVLGLGVTMTRQTFQSIYWQNRHAASAATLERESDVRIFVNHQGDTLQYLLREPLNFDPQKKYPLVVCLPYHGYEAPPAMFLSLPANRKQYPAFLFVPHGKPGSSWGGPLPARFNLRARDKLLCQALLALDDPAIDVSRRYVSGVSNGGYGSWHLISTHPEMFAAAIPVCGAGATTLAAQAARVPVWAFHGAKDRNVLVSGTRKYD